MTSSAAEPKLLLEMSEAARIAWLSSPDEARGCSTHVTSTHWSSHEH